MSYFFILIVFMFVLYFLSGPRSIAGDAIYKGGLDSFFARALRFIVFFFIFYGLLLAAKVSGASFVFEAILALVGMLLIEGYEISKDIRHAREAKRAKRLVIAFRIDYENIPTPVVVQESENQRLSEILHTGRLDDILALCVENMEPGQQIKRFRIPRWLTRDEYKALQSAMRKKNWFVEYTMLCAYMNSPTLCIAEIKAPRAAANSDRN